MEKYIKSFKYILLIAIFSVVCTLNTVSAKAEKYEQTDSTPNSVLITWEEPEDCDGYYIGWGEDVKAAKKMVDSKKCFKAAGYKSHIISGLKPGTKYYICIYYKVKTSGYVDRLIEDEVAFTAPGKITGLKKISLDYYLKNTIVSWNTQLGVSGYEYTLKNSSGKVVKKGNIASETESQVKIDIENNQFYTISVRAYSNRRGKLVYGAWSSVVVGSQPIVKTAKASSSGLKITWNKLGGANKYTVYASTSPKKGYKKIGTTKGTSYTIKKINGKKINSSTTYYVYIVASKGSNTGSKIFYNKIKGPVKAQLEF